MAGEWIKVTTNLSTKPEVFKLARLIGTNVDHAVGMLFRFWCWADLITVDGVVDGVVARDVDDVVYQEGFCDALAQTGWVEILPNNSGIRLPNFERHNGESAKKRALKNERQARWRAGNVDGEAPQKRLQERLPEKRREEKTNTPRAKNSKVEIPTDFQPSEETKAWAVKKGFAEFLPAHLDYFRDYAASSGKVYADWDAAFRNCVKGDWGGVRKNYKPQGGTRRLAI
jgi:hypothetical protein